MNREERRRLIHRYGAARAAVDARMNLDNKINRFVRDATVQAQADMATQRAMWLMVVSIADAYGFGPKRMEKFFAAFQANTEQLQAWIRENGEEYAYEKMRQAAERATGSEIQYLYEKDWRKKLKDEKRRPG